MPTKRRTKRKLRIWALLVLIVGMILIVSLLGFGLHYLFAKNDVVEMDEEKVVKEVIQEETDVIEEASHLLKPANSISREGMDEFTSIDSYLIVANKKHKLPDGYVPYDLAEPEVIHSRGEAPMRYEAAVALEEMFGVRVWISI